MKKSASFGFLLIVLVGFASATDFYVRSDGTATSKGAATSCSSASTATSLPWANSNILAGDTAYLCDTGGEYTGSEYISPTASGISNTDRVIYKNAPGDTPVIHTGANSYGLYISNDDWVQVEGITFKAEMLARIINSDYNYFLNCVFDWRESSDMSSYTGVYIYGGSKYNKFENCEFYGSQDTVRVGDSYSDDNTNYNYFENIIAAYSRHSSFQMSGTSNIVRNSYLHNDAVSSWGCQGQSSCGGRAYSADAIGSSRTLFENNRVAFCEEDEDPNYLHQGYDAGSYEVIRRNMFYANTGNGMQITNEDGYTPTFEADYNLIYHNTFYYNGAAHPIGYKAWKWNLCIADWGGGDPNGNVIKNNIFYDSFGEDAESPSLGVDGVRLYNVDSGVNTIHSNFWGYKQSGVDYEDGDPLFVDSTIPSDKTDDSLPDFSLREGSGAIDSATYLTLTANSASSPSTTLRVNNADYYFNPSPFASQSWMGVPDQYIFVDGWSAPIKISSIDHDTDTITLESPATWDSGVGTYDAVSPTVGYYGNGADQGAFEYASSPTCTDDWQCTEWSSWSECTNSQKTRTRTCTDANNCGTATGKPSETETQSCDEPEILLAHWKLDENPGDIAADSAGDNDGTINGAEWTTGRIGDALSFDGADDHVSLSYAISFGDDDQYTISFWINTGEITEWVGVLGGGDDQWQDYIFIHKDDERLSFYDGTTHYAAGLLTVGAWHHAVLVSDSGTMRWYLDNVKAEPIYSMDEKISISEFANRYGGSQGRFNGAIDDIRIYNYALDDSEVMALFDSAESQCSAADEDRDSVVDIDELINHINRWKAGDVGISDIMTAIGEWKDGC